MASFSVAPSASKLLSTRAPRRASVSARASANPTASPNSPPRPAASIKKALHGPLRGRPLSGQAALHAKRCWNVHPLRVAEVEKEEDSYDEEDEDEDTAEEDGGMVFSDEDLVGLASQHQHHSHPALAEANRLVKEQKEKLKAAENQVQALQGRILSMGETIDSITCDKEKVEEALQDAVARHVEEMTEAKNDIKELNQILKSKTQTMNKFVIEQDEKLAKIKAATEGVLVKGTEDVKAAKKELKEAQEAHQKAVARHAEEMAEAMSDIKELNKVLESKTQTMDQFVLEQDEKLAKIKAATEDVLVKGTEDVKAAKKELKEAQEARLEALKVAKRATDEAETASIDALAAAESRVAAALRANAEALEARIGGELEMACAAVAKLEEALDITVEAAEAESARAVEQAYLRGLREATTGIRDQA
mmetsp:Transcript_1111/g.4519  ORF Transcript_1111/g.4519 Transcript_1111/m.4519 type:complete len:422 (+) Transcript_1111:152-1417(+)